MCDFDDYPRDFDPDFDEPEEAYSEECYFEEPDYSSDRDNEQAEPVDDDHDFPDPFWIGLGYEMGLDEAQRRKKAKKKK